ncbi:MAG: heme o synthase [Geminicoccaceae bacterium]
MVSSSPPTTLIAETARRGTPTASEIRDYWVLLKPNVMRLVVFTGFVGLYLAPGDLHPVLAAVAMLCIAVAAGAAAAINNWYDSDIDAEMGRTRRRPTASGRISPHDALTCGVTLAILSIMTMGVAVNWMAGALLAVTIGFYILIYTVWLKRRTPQNIVIGGAAGAFPPMIGWAAVTGSIDLMPLLMFAIIFTWTPAHFWALALVKRGDYQRVSVPMLPVVESERHTLNQIFVYTALLIALSLLPLPFGTAGASYGVAAAALGVWYGHHVWRLWRRYTDMRAMAAFKVSIAYLFGLFLAMVADKLIGGMGLV